MSEVDQQDLLSRIVAHNERHLREREAAGDPTVWVDLIQHPWSLHGFGAPVSRSSDLHKIAESVIHSTGILKDQASKREKLHWLDLPELRERFFAELKDAKGRPWSEFLAGALVAWDARDNLPPLKKRWDALSFRDRPDPDEAVLMRRAQRADTLAEDAIDRAWRQLFTSAQVLAFRYSSGRWQFQLPHIWGDAAPPHCTTISELRRSNESHEEEQPQAPTQQGAFGSVAIQLPMIDRGIVSWRPQSNDVDLKLLISADLPPSLHPKTANAAGGSKAKPAKRGRPSTAEDDERYIREAREGLRSGKFPSAHAAAVSIESRMMDKERNGATSPSIVRRLMDRIKAAVGDE